MSLIKSKWGGAVVAGGLLFQVGLGQAPHVDQQPFLERFCVECHSGSEPQGDFDLGALPWDFAEPGARERWDLLLDYVVESDMPPEEADVFPSHQERTSFVSELREQMALADLDSGIPAPPLRRLSRSELLLTTRDLFDLRGLQLPPGLPDDRTDEHFDTMAEGLNLSTTYLAGVFEFAADVANRMVPPMVQTTHGTRANAWNFGKMGWKLLDGSYKFTGVNVAAWSGAIRDHGFIAPASGVYRIALRVRADGPVGHDGQALRLGFYALVPGAHAFPERSLRASLARVGSVEVSNLDYATVICEIELEAGESFHVYCENRLADVDASGGLDRLQLSKLVAEAKLSEAPSVQVMSMRMRGPIAHLSRQKAFYGAARPASDEAGLRAVLLPLAERACRRPLEKAEGESLMASVMAHAAQVAEPRLALHFGIRRILCSASFLHHGLGHSPGLAGKPNQYRLANRLSYFFWGSLPDTELLALAKAGVLSQPDLLHSQVERLLDDPKARRFTESFTGQWLGGRRMKTLMVCNVRHPWNELLRDGFIRSTEMFFDEILRGNLSVRNFIDSEFTFATPVMRSVWGIPGEYEGLAAMEIHQRQSRVWPAAQRLELDRLPAGTPAWVAERGGVLGLPTVLAATGDGVESSPILRGVWLLENMFGDPPPPPPADVPALVADTSGAKTIRESLIAHQASKSCAKCHSKIDPLGFALEHYDAIGNWRDLYPPLLSTGDQAQAGLPIDTFSRLPDGAAMSGMRDIKQYLLERPDVFTACLAGKLLEYGLGRELVQADRLLIEQLLENEPVGGYGFRDLIHALVQSAAFVQP